VEKIKLQQNEDPELMKIQKGVKEGRNKDFTLREDVLWYRNRLCVPNALNSRKELLKEAHDSTLTTYPRSTKMYDDLKTHFWRIGMKKDITNCVAQCLICHKLKIERQKPGDLL